MSSHSRSWSVYNRKEITHRYEILETIGSGAYSDVYRARRLSDNLTVALKEIHDYESAYREIEALQALQNSPNIVNLLEYFWEEGEDAVLVLEYLSTDLAAVISEAKKNREKKNGISLGEIKRWMVQMLHGVDACHRNSIVHRDLKPANLLISEDGVLKLADFGQARILIGDSNQHEQSTSPNKLWPPLQQTEDNAHGESSGAISKEEYMQELHHFKADIDANFNDRDASCAATCTTTDREDDPFKSSYSYDAEGNPKDGTGTLTSCVGTRWFKAPELLYGSTSYGLEIDLWSLGCIFAELLNLEPLFPGTSDIDQHFRIISVLGNLTEEVWPGCSNLPDYGKICFEKIEKPRGLEGCMQKYSTNEICLLQRLVCYDPASRATAMELLNDKYFQEEPLPIALNELRVPSRKNQRGERSPGEWFEGSDSDDEYSGGGGFDVSTTGTDFSIRFS